MITPDDLLDFAFQLVMEAKGSEAYARRAISACYYALFHKIALDGAALFAGSPAQQARIARSYDHGAVAGASREVGRLRPAPGSTPDTRLMAVADSFLSLQEARERADYDLASNFGWDNTEELFWEAFDACQLLAEIRALPAFVDFLLAPLIQKRGRRG